MKKVILLFVPLILIWCSSNTIELSFDEKEKCLSFKKLEYVSNLTCYPYESSEIDPECVWDSLNFILNSSYKDSSEREFVNWYDCRMYSNEIILSCLDISSERLKNQCAYDIVDKILAETVNDKATTLPKEDIKKCVEKQLEVYSKLNKCYITNNVISYEDWSVCDKDSNSYTKEERCRWITRNAIKPCLEIANYSERSSCWVEKISQIN